MTTLRARRWPALALLTAMTACSAGGRMLALPPKDLGTDPPPSGATQPAVGGQSGTDGQGGVSCPQPNDRNVGFDEVTPAGTAASVRNKFEEKLSKFPMIPLNWTAEVGALTSLTIEVQKWGQPHLREFPTICGRELLLPVTLHLTTGDGLLDETLTGDLDNNQWVAAYDSAMLQQSAIGRELRTKFDRPGLTLEGFMVQLVYGDTDPAGIMGYLGLSAYADDPTWAGPVESLAKFDTAWPWNIEFQKPYVRPQTFDAACKAAQAGGGNMAARTGGSNMLNRADAVIAAMSGTWILCSGESKAVDARSAGLEVSADGTWQRLGLHDGELVEQTGFDDQGTLQLIITVIPASIPSTNPGGALIYDTTLGYIGVSAEQLQLDTKGIDSTSGYLFMYARTDRPVGPPYVERMAGERAGEAACAEGEANARGFASLDDLRTHLVGSWAICHGGFREGAVAIAFAADGTYKHLDASGKTIIGGSYRVLSASVTDWSGTHDLPTVAMQDDDDDPEGTNHYYNMTGPLMSDAPVKLQANDDGNTILSAQP